MRIFANLFLILFLADGALSTVDELFSLLSVQDLSGIRNAAAGLVVLLSAAIYLCLGIDRRLPKQVFLPAVAFIFWSLTGTWLFPTFTAEGYGLLMAGSQLSLALILLRQVRVLEGEPLLAEARFRAPLFGARNTLVFCGVNLVVLPPLLVLLLLSSAARQIEEASAGFIRLAPDGLYMTERIYRKGDKSVRLAGMIHFGEKEYYESLAASVPSPRTVVLAEGVSDAANRLPDRMGYGKMAGILGLTPQDRKLFRGRPIDEEDLGDPSAGDAASPDILRADVDMSTFRPATIAFLAEAGREMARNDSLTGALLAMNAWARRNMTPETEKVILEDILHGRNRVLLGYLDRVLPRYDTVVIPWGALHMAGIEQGVLARGFVLQEERERRSIGFAKLLAGGERPQRKDGQP
ncbi:MAG TPA: hypothetical protein VNX25_06750 [Verrucomicrobiae bacterium]|nr:hypothetical protein [Verrucomicrobiae bacterium]